MEKWVVSAKGADFKKIGETFHIDPVLARIIRNRDIIGETQIREYLYGTKEQLFSPWMMKDMEKGVSILIRKIQEGKNIRIIGDYDIDGICSTYILLKGIRACAGNTDMVIPHRIRDGYGINEHLIQDAFDAGVDTIITCDNGIAAIDAINYGKELGMTIVVTDHHDIPYEILEDGSKKHLRSEADAIINPKQAECEYPFKGLCGGAVAYKFIQALYEKMGKTKEEAECFLEFAGIATVGDVMDLIGENRILVKEGLQQLNATSNPGLMALIEACKLDPGKINAYHIGFVIGPCLNAAGRLETARKSLQLLLSEGEEAKELAKELVELNQERKDMTLEGVEKAVAMIEEKGYDKDDVMVVYLPECHESLAGIIAGRIREKYNKPVFVLTKSEEGMKGSGRSIESYSMYEELVKVKSHLTKFGGHPMAAGLSLLEEEMEGFRQDLNRNSTLTEEDFIPKIVIDVPMPMDYVYPDFIRSLKILEPFGKANTKPVFADRDVTLQFGKIVGKNQNVMKMNLLTSTGRKVDGVYFGDMERFLHFVEEKYGEAELEKLLTGRMTQIKMSVIYYPDLNSFQGRESVQMVIQNFC